MMRPPSCDKLQLKRGPWTEEEDAKMLAYVSKHGTGNWTAVPKRAGLKRCGKSCRLRWTNYLRPDLKHESFTAQEEELIIKLHAAIGSRWSIIAQQLHGRTDNDVKNYWNTKLRRKLMDRGIDPVTHKPFSQILADYGNIGGFSRSGNRNGSIYKDLKTAFMRKADPYAFLTTTTTTTIAAARPLLPPPQSTSPSFPNNSLSSKSNAGNNSLDLLTQLQAITTLVTEASSRNYNPEQISPDFFSQISSSSSSDVAQAVSPEPFSWRDFLLEEAFTQGDHAQEEKETHLGISSNTRPAITAHNKSQTIAGVDHPEGNGQIESAPLSSDSSFVEAMLGQERDTFMDFPDLIMEELLSS
ncbi:hypothetical protein Nepgr_018669 [Nepenthes gracilis]|uniref:Uncharacterized protein n=1 Tax=Nepenthes gracilis TaxID=150966 RepID=A0AAD3XTM2_NEPGR|nr:hypothetical protein Nepgr_018669 [Nepenthes gracilis]